MLLLNHLLRIAILFVCVLPFVCADFHLNADEPVVVNLDVSETPHLAKWGNRAKTLIIEWHPRLQNLIPTKGFTPPREIDLVIRKTDKGVGGTSGTRITLSSHWLEKHPDDFGLVIHELVHVIQSYPNGEPWWLTEGIADYLRWGIYEGKKQSWFPKPKVKQGYKRGYRVTAGFLLWLETEIEPGIVKKINSALRNGKYTDKIFENETGKTLSSLWDTYTAEK